MVRKIAFCTCLIDCTQADSALLAATLQTLPQAIPLLLLNPPATAQYPACAICITIDSGALWAQRLEASAGVTTDYLLVLQAGVLLPRMLRERLAGLLENSMASALSPLSIRHRELSIIDNPDVACTLPVAELDQWRGQYAEGKCFDWPLINQRCALLRLESFSDLPRQLSDTDFYTWIQARALTLLATDAAVVDDTALAICSDLPDALELPTAVLSTLTSHGVLGQVRHPLGEIIAREERIDPQNYLPCQLHVAHSWGGGLGRWVEDYFEADVWHKNYVLRPIGDWDAFGRQIALYDTAHMGQPLRCWQLSMPIVSIAVEHYEYQAIVHEVIKEFAIERLVISSFIGQSLGLLKTGLPTTQVLHDYTPFCPALYATFDNSCQNCTSTRLNRCLGSNPLAGIFRHQGAEYWEMIRQHYLAFVQNSHVRLVAPTESVKKRYQALMPALPEIEVIPHGIKTSLCQQLAEVEYTQEPERRLQILMLGGVTEAKGAVLLHNLLDELLSFADVVLLGAGEGGGAFEGKTGVRVIPQYHWQEMQGYLNDLKPDLGLLLSIVPETFSYTLSELWAARIPVLATDLGAFSDRIIEGRNGWLIEADSVSVLSKLKWLDNNPKQIAFVRQYLEQQPVKTAAQMADQYYALAPLEPAPLTRFLPSKAHTTASAERHSPQALYINHQMGYRQVLAAFLDYTRGKLEGSPRLPGWLGRWVGKMLGLLRRWVVR